MKLTLKEIDEQTTAFRNGALTEEQYTQWIEDARTRLAHLGADDISVPVVFEEMTATALMFSSLKQQFGFFFQ